MIAVKPLGFESPFANRHPVHGAYIGLHRHHWIEIHFDMGIMPSNAQHNMACQIDWAPSSGSYSWPRRQWSASCECPSLTQNTSSAIVTSVELLTCVGGLEIPIYFKICQRSSGSQYPLQTQSIIIQKKQSTRQNFPQNPTKLKSRVQTCIWSLWKDRDQCRQQ